MHQVDDVIKQLEAQKAAIDRALDALRELDGSGAYTSSQAVAVNKRSVAQKARWAATRPGTLPDAPANATRKGGISPAGRKALAEAMKRRWAVKRAAAQAKKTVRKAA